MPRRFKRNETVREGARRIAAEMLAAAAEELKGSRAGARSEAIHETRRLFKRLRALLRLLRNELGDKKYHAENACFRDAGRRLAGARDAQVALKTLAAIHAEDPLPRAVQEKLHAALEARCAEDLQRLEESRLFGEMEEFLGEARERAADWKLSGKNHESLLPALRRAYKRSRDAMRAASMIPAPENLHEWRKRVKYLAAQAKLLKGIDKKPLKKLAEELKELEDKLGLDHDMVIFDAWLQSWPGLDALEKSERAALDSRIGARRAGLIAEAMKLGGPIHAKTPREFIDVIG